MDDLVVGGVRTTVSTEALAAFGQRCRSLNMAHVAAALKLRLGDESWQTQLVRAAGVLHARLGALRSPSVLWCARQC